MTPDAPTPESFAALAGSATVDALIADVEGTRAQAPNPALSSAKTGQDSGKAVSEAPRGTVKFTVLGDPIGKPRMTQRDKWQKRPAVVRYRQWADRARAAAPEDMPADPLIVSWTAYLPMPASWSAKKRAAHAGTWHRQKPDRDNIDKAVLDALFPSDCGIAGGTLVKRWDDGHGPRIIVKVEGL